MMNEIKPALETQMTKAIDSLKYQLTKVRTGRASASVLDGVSVDYYGSATPVAQVGQISTPEARLLQIQPFDKTLIADIEKAIMAANLGLTPSNDGNLIRIPFPALTEERRIDLAKQSKAEAEHAKVGIRNARKDANNDIKKIAVSDDMKKNAEDDVQKLTDAFVKDIDEKASLKEKEIMKV